MALLALPNCMVLILVTPLGLCNLYVTLFPTFAPEQVTHLVLVSPSNAPSGDERSQSEVAVPMPAPEII